MDLAVQSDAGTLDLYLQLFGFPFGVPHQCIVNAFLDIVGSDF